MNLVHRNSLRVIKPASRTSGQRVITEHHTGSMFMFLFLIRWLMFISVSKCDSPLRLTNFTLDFLDEHWTSEIDFVICEIF